VSNEARRGNAAVSPVAGTNPWLIALIVSVAAFMEVLDTTIANVALRYIAGGLAVGPSQAAWVVTSYLVANSIVLCASGWLATTFGRRNFFMTSIAFFAASSVLCGFSWNLQSLLFFRVLQGLAGGGLTPVALSILADAFAPAKRGQALAVFGVAVVVAPVVGPVLGGWLSDNLSWHWCFLINGPVGVASFVSVYFFIKEKKQEKIQRAKKWKEGLTFDLVGFLLIATFLGALEIVLDKGQEEDWFGSSFIILFASLSAAALVVFIPWALVKEEPILDIRMLASRQFGACFIVMLGVGAVLIATTQILPQLLQENYGYTATLAGLALTPGGIVTMIMMFVVGSLSFIPAKYLIAIGAAFVAYGMYFSMSLYSDSDFSFFAWSRIITSIGLPLLFIPVTEASYSGLRHDQTDQASSLINLARNFGGSIGVSIAQTMLVRREQFHQSRLIEQIGTWNPNYQQTLQSAQSYFGTQPSSGSSSQVASAWIGLVLQQQASLMSYIDVFVVLCFISALLIPLALTLKSSKAGKSHGAGRGTDARPTHYRNAER
jgi:MFS transporter, DHA2 family, multidrug resistance protein